MDNLKNATADALKWWICHHFVRRNAYHREYHIKMVKMYIAELRKRKKNG